MVTSPSPPTSWTITECPGFSRSCSVESINGNEKACSPQADSSGLRSTESMTQYQKSLQSSDSDSVKSITYGDDIDEQEKNQRETTPDPSIDMQNGLSHKNHGRLIGLPHGIDLNNVIDYHEDDKSLFELGTPDSSALTLSYALRNRGVKRSKLAYDLKYHPMDDSIRPSQAAKRRSAHGEDQLHPQNSYDTLFEGLDTDADMPILTDNESEVEENPKLVLSDKKCKKVPPCSSGALRRSSRTKSCPRKAYDMKIHPQDEELQMLSDGETVMRVPSRKRKRRPSVRPTMELNSDNDVSNLLKNKRQEATHTEGSDCSDDIIVDFENPSSTEQVDLEVNQDLNDKTSSPSSTMSVALPAGIRQKKGLDAWQLLPGKRYFRHDRDSWPSFQGQSFEIFEEHLEDQLAAEAKMLSPLNYEHDDKENTVNVLYLPYLPRISNSHDGISVMPGSRYRPSDEDHRASETLALVNHALYDTPREFSESYGLEGNDGTREEGPNHLTILRSSAISAEIGQVYDRNFMKDVSRLGATTYPDSVLGSSSSVQCRSTLSDRFISPSYGMGMR